MGRGRRRRKEGGGGGEGKKKKKEKKSHVSLQRRRRKRSGKTWGRGGRRDTSHVLSPESFKPRVATNSMLSRLGVIELIWNTLISLHTIKCFGVCLNYTV